MADDTTLHFPHLPTHPDVLYVPRHVMMHAVPPLGIAALVLGAVAVVVLVRQKKSPYRIAIGVLAAALVIGGGASILLRGSFVGVLPDKTHFIAYTDAGDDAHQYFSTAAQALAQATSDGDDQGLSPSSARAVAVRWADIPAADRAELTSGSSEGNTSPAVGWNDDDSDLVQTYLRKTYGVAPTDLAHNAAESYRQAVEAPGMASGSFPDDITHSTEVTVPGNPLHITEDYAHYQCLLHVTDYHANELGQPVSARPVSLECVVDYTVMNAGGAIPAGTPHVMVKKLGS